METATRSFLGWDADLWAAIGALAIPVIIAILGVWWGRFQQQARWASERFQVQGIQRLHGALSTFLSIHLQNYQIGGFIIRAMKTYEPDHPLAPQPNEIPEFLGQRFDAFPIDPLLPVQELLGDKVILDWVMMLISDVTLEAKEGEFQIRQPIAAYYREHVPMRVDEAVARMTAVLEAWNSRVSTHFALLDRLNDLDRHIGTKRPWTQGGYYAVKNRREVVTIVKHMKTGLEAVTKAHDDTRGTLRSGGATT